MNQKQRKGLSKVVDALKANRDQVTAILGSEQDKMDNWPENLQSTEAFSQIEEDSCGLEDALMSLDEAIDMLQGLTNK